MPETISPSSSSFVWVKCIWCHSLFAWWDTTRLCLGMDQVIVSAIENEKDNISSICDIAACWADICNKFFINADVTKHLQVFEANLFCTQWSTVLHQQKQSTSTKCLWEIWFWWILGMNKSLKKSYKILISSTMQCTRQQPPVRWWQIGTQKRASCTNGWNGISSPNWDSSSTPETCSRT